jgi:RNA polymerase sigma-70 factor (ECF subfamily)
MNAPEGPGRSDEALVAEALREPGSRRGRDAASELLGRYQRRVYLWCYRYARDPDRALDLAQEVLMSAYRSLHTFQGRAKFSSWLFVVARNRCLNAVTAPSLLRDDDADLDALPGAAPDPAAEFERRIDEHALRELLAAHLGEDEREALWLRCFERLPVDEITRVMGLDSASGARGLLQRARRHLKAALDERDRKETRQ